MSATHSEAKRTSPLERETRMRSITIVISENNSERIELRRDNRGAIFGAKIEKSTGNICWSKREYNTKKALERDLATSDNFWDA